MHKSLVAVWLAAIVQAQANDSTDTADSAVQVLDCSALSCSGDNGVGLCSTTSSTGVGVIPRVLRLANLESNLSLTLSDGQPAGFQPEALGHYPFSTRTLYVGAPPETDISDQAPGCMLMMQYEAMTFPTPSDTNNGDLYSPNTTSCPTEFTTGSNVASIASHIKAFRYSASSGDDSAGMLPRCEALAQFVEASIRRPTNDNESVPGFGVYYPSLVTVNGGAFSGPDAETTVANVSGNGTDTCQPTSPNSYQLHRVVSAIQVLSADSSDPDSTSGGRSGYTPLVSVAYNDGDDTDPEVHFYCVHLYDTNGAELPFSELRRDSKAAARLNFPPVLALALGLIVTGFVVL